MHYKHFLHENINQLQSSILQKNPHVRVHNRKTELREASELPRSVQTTIPCTPVITKPESEPHLR